MAPVSSLSSAGPIRTTNGSEAQRLRPGIVDVEARVRDVIEAENHRAVVGQRPAEADQGPELQVVAQVGVALPVVAGHEAGLDEGVRTERRIEDEARADPGVALRVRAGGDAPGARDRARTAEDGRAVKLDDAAEIAAVDVGGQAETQFLRRGGPAATESIREERAAPKNALRGITMSLALPASGFVFLCPEFSARVLIRKERAQGPLSPFRLIRLDQKDMFRPKDQVLTEPERWAEPFTAGFAVAVAEVGRQAATEVVLLPTGRSRHGPPRSRTASQSNEP
jgi:hypothetical protein